MLNDIRNRIVRTAKPIKIIIFGSYAKGRHGPDSDLDILVIKETSLPRYKRDKEIRLAIREYMFSKDILVYTPEEVKEWENVKSAFVTTAIREGKVLYEKQN